ncbi:MAG: glycosyltransferase [Patescibacteria group bacterium]|jgi:glycosyltransferase involved in cell wall biosynthesis
MAEHRKLNIAMVCDPITDLMAGAIVSTMRFATLLKERGHNIIFIAAKSPKNPHNNTVKGIPIYRSRGVLLPKSEGQLYISWPGKRKIKKILVDEKIDLVHIFFPLPSAYIAVKAARELGIKSISHSHSQPENIFLHMPKFLAEGVLNEMWYSYLIWLYKKTDAVIFPSPFAKKIFPYRFKNKKKIIISNGVDTNRFKKINADKFLSKFKLSKKDKNILFVGRLHPEKHVDTVIQALPIMLQKRKDIHLFIVGFGHLEEQLKKLVAGLGIANNITFCGRVTGKELVLAYNACDLFVLPSLAELEGMVVLEALACGKPILIANSYKSAAADFVHKNGLLFRPKSHRDLAKQALKIFSNEEHLKKMGEESLKMSRHYDLNESVDKLENFYYSVLQK